MVGSAVYLKEKKKTSAAFYSYKRKKNLEKWRVQIELRVKVAELFYTRT